MMPYLTDLLSKSQLWMQTLACMQLIGGSWLTWLPSCKGSWKSIWLFNAWHELSFLKHGNGGLDADRQPPERVPSAMKKKEGVESRKGLPLGRAIWNGRFREATHKRRGLHRDLIEMSKQAVWLPTRMRKRYAGKARLVQITVRRPIWWE